MSFRHVANLVAAVKRKLPCTDPLHEAPTTGRPFLPGIYTYTCPNPLCNKVTPIIIEPKDLSTLYHESKKEIGL